MASKEISPLNTTHLYYADTELLSNTAEVIGEYSVEINGSQLLAIVLDQTVMHPQGGGQPADSGLISSIDGSSVRFEVCHVQKPKDSTFIEHIGKYTTDLHFALGEEVRAEVDGPKRMLHARLHSAGHLLDSALANIGITDLIPSKGYHFPDGPYVEYIGNVPAEKREEVIQQLNKEVEKLIKDAVPVSVEKNEKGERVVNVGGVGCPCGGTHVKNTADIRGVTVTKIKKSKKNVRVSYIVDDE